MASNVPPPPGAVPPRKKTSPLVWILLGIAGFFLLIGMLVVAGGFFVLHKARQAGLDPGLIKRNPALAAVKMMVAANPDAELVSVDEDRGVVTVRDKKTGKTVTMDFEQVRKGRISFQEEGKEKVTVEARGEGATGSLEVKSSEGSVKFGAGGPLKLPAWFPEYPGAATQGTYSMQGAAGEAGSFHFTTKDPLERVLDFYEGALKKAGMKVTTLKQDKGGMITGEDEAQRRKAVIVISIEAAGTAVSANFESKP